MTTVRATNMSSASPVVTVGVPVYNAERYLAEALRSILSQTFTDFELVISDNASTDGTRGICNDFARADPRIRYLRQARNMGAPRNYNALVTLARGRYFKWSSSNDLIEPEFLAACVPILEARPDVVLVYPRTRYFDTNTGSVRDHADNLDIQDDDPVERYKQCDRRLFDNNVMNGLIRRQALRSSTLHWDYRSSDMELVVELALYGKFVEVPRPLFYLRTEAAARYDAAHHRLYYPHQIFAHDAFCAWQTLGQMLQAANRAPLSFSDRVRLYDYLARRVWWRRKRLMGIEP
jgi:glycosyltransferase involved in cell wall biosynthesis